MTAEDERYINLVSDVRDSVNKRFDKFNDLITDIQVAHVKSITELKVKMALIGIVGSTAMSVIVTLGIHLYTK